MPNKKTPPATPLTFDVNGPLLETLRTEQKRSGARSVSEIVRDAVESFDYNTYTPESVDHRQISVRIAESTRRKLVRTAKSRKVSVGEVVRAALCSHLKVK